MTLETQRAVLHGLGVTMVAALALLVVEPPSALTLGISFALGLIAGIVTYVREHRT